MQKGQLGKAIKEYLKLVQEDASDIRTWLKVADLYSKCGDLENATETYRKVADYYARQGFYLKAVAVNKQILKIDPNLLNVHLELASLYKQLGLLGDAIAQYQTVIAQLEESGRRAESIEVFRKMLDLDPDNITGRIKLAESYSKEGMVEDAVREFHVACDYLRANDRIKDYIKVAERLLYHEPSNIDLARELAQLYLDKDDPKRALAKLQLCFKENPRNEAVLAMLADAFNSLGQTQKTIPVLKELIKVYRENGKEKEVEETFRIILELDPGDRSALNSLNGGPQAVPPPVERRIPVTANAGPSKFPRSRPPSVDAESIDIEMIEELSGITEDADESIDDDVHVVLEEEASLDLSVSPMEALSDYPKRVGRLPDGGTAEIFGQIDELETDSLQPEEGSVEEVLLLEEIDVLEEGSVEVDLADSEPDAPAKEAKGEPEIKALNEKQLKKLLTEVEIYIKLNLHEKALQHLMKIFELDADNLEALAYTKEIYEYLGYQDKVVEVLVRLCRLVMEQDRTLAEDFYTEAMRIDSTHPDVVLAAALFDGAGKDAGSPLASSAYGVSAVTPAVREVMPQLEVTVSAPSVVEPAPVPEPEAAVVEPQQRPSPRYSDSQESEIEGQLEEIGFFIDSGLEEEAVALLQELQTDYPQHPKVLEMAHKIDG